MIWCSERGSCGHFSLVHALLWPCPTSPKPSYLICLQGSEIWPGASLWFMAYLPKKKKKTTKQKTSIVCKPLSWHSLMTGRWGARGTCSGWVVCPTWLGDKAEPRPHDCEITSGTQQLWLQVQTTVAGWADGGKTQKNLKICSKKPVGSLHVALEETAHVTVRVTSPTRPHREIKDFFGVMYRWWKLPEDVAVDDLRMEFPHCLWALLVMQGDASPSGLLEHWWFCNSL